MSDRSQTAPVLAVVLFASALGGFALLKSWLTGPGVAGDRTSSKAPPIDLPLLGGGRLDLSEELGKRVIVLNFFATWCGPCRAEMPEIVRFAGTLPERVRFVGIDMGETEAEVRPFLAAHGVRYPVGIDARETIAEAYGVRGIPTTVVIDGTGMIVWRDSGAIGNADAELGPAVRDAVARLGSRG